MSLQSQAGGVVVSDSHWDAFLASTAGGSHRQTSSWARVKQLQGWESRRVVVHDPPGDRIVGGAQILVKPLPYIPAAGRIGYVVKGPLMASADPVAQGRVVDEIHRLCRAERVAAVVIQPAAEAPPIASLLVDRGYTPSQHSLAPTSTVVVDLDANIDVLWQRLGKNLRKNIRRAEAKGVTVRCGQREDLDVFYRFLTAAAQRRSYSIFPRAYYERIWDEFAPRDQAQLFVAELGGQPVSIQLCVTFRDTMFAKALAWSGEHRSVHVNDVLDWKTMTWAHEHGITRYDLEGIPDELARRLLAGDTPPESEIKGRHAYKLKWGGNAVILPRPYVRVTNPLIRGLMNLAPDGMATGTLRKLRKRIRIEGKA